MSASSSLWSPVVREKSVASRDWPAHNAARAKLLAVCATAQSYHRKLLRDFDISTVTPEARANRLKVINALRKEKLGAAPVDALNDLTPEEVSEAARLLADFYLPQEGE